MLLSYGSTCYIAAVVESIKLNLDRDSIETTPLLSMRWPKALQPVRALCLAILFLSSSIAIQTTQNLGAPLYFINRKVFYAYIARTKQSFGILCCLIHQCFSPTVVILTGEKSFHKMMRETDDGRVELDFDERIVLIANHQLYLDWIYLWWAAYAARMHGAIYIILKESLKHIPLIGWGMQYYGFIFLARNMATDKPRFEHRLQRLSESDDWPLWLLIFPEGTNYSPKSLKKSEAFSKKVDIPNTRNVLLPRANGLYFCVKNLKPSVKYIYDCTLAYDGVPQGDCGHDHFNLWSTYVKDRSTNVVHMHWRKFEVGKIPLANVEDFGKWLQARWVEKDDMLDFYYKTGSFQNFGGSPIQAKVKIASIWDVWQMYDVIATVAIIAYLIWRLNSIFNQGVVSA